MQLPIKEKKFLLELGVELRALRNAKGWTLEQMEEKGWPSWRHLQQIEMGRKNINVTTLKRLADLYGYGLSELCKKLGF